MGLQGILFYFIAALLYFILFYMCGRLKSISSIVLAVVVVTRY